MTEKQFALSLTASELDVIGAALGKLPYESVAGLFEKIRAQFNQQNTPADAAPADTGNADKGAAE